MVPKTHLGINAGLCGRVLSCGPGVAEVALVATDEMSVDGFGLVHGGFVFGFADYAAMVAINDPLVVLGAADVRLLAPVKVGDRLHASARAEGPIGRKNHVDVRVTVGTVEVMAGRFTCYILDEHVLVRAGRAG